jgi:hypothetical protein
MISVSAAVSAQHGNATAMAAGSIYGEEGNDIINVTATKTSNAGDSSNYAFAMSYSNVNGGDGDDEISVTATSTSDVDSYNYVCAMLSSNIDGGEGNDTISVTAGSTGSASDYYPTSALREGSSIDGGAGDDIINVSVSSFDDAYTMNNSASISGGDGHDIIRVAAASSSGAAYAMGYGSNVIEGEAGNDHIIITGRVAPNGAMPGDWGLPAQNLISGGEDSDGQDWDILQIDQNNMADILAVSGQGNISGFEQLILDMTNDGGTLNLDSTLLGRLTTINSSPNGEKNLLVINGDGNDTINASGLQPATENQVVEIDGTTYNAYTYNDGAADAQVYIQQEIVLNSGG